VAEVATKNMLNVLPSAQAGTEPAWVVRLEIQLLGGRRKEVSDVELESMLELMMRTRAVRSAAASASAGPALCVDIRLTAARGEEAVERARSLVECSARYAGVGPIALREGLAVPERAASGARGWINA